MPKEGEVDNREGSQQILIGTEDKQGQPCEAEGNHGQPCCLWSDAFLHSTVTTVASQGIWITTCTAHHQ